MSLKEIVKTSIDELEKRLHWHIHYDMIPSYIVSENFYDSRRSNGKFDYFDRLKFNDPLIQGKIFDLNSIRDEIYRKTSICLHQSMLESVHKLEELDITTKLTGNIYCFKIVDGTNEKVVIYYNVAQDTFETYEMFGEHFMKPGSHNNPDDLLEQEKMIDDFTYDLTSYINNLDGKYNVIDIVLVQEINDLLIPILSDEYKEYCRKRITSSLGETINGLILSFYSTSEFLNTYFPRKIVDYTMKRVESVYNNYCDYFSLRGSGRLLNDYKETIVETFMANSNTVYGTRYKIDWSKVSFIRALIYYLSNKQLEEDIHMNKKRSESICNYRYGLYFEDMKDHISSNIELLSESLVYKALMTSEWAISNIGLVDFVDNTFLCSGYFKAIEILLFKIISKHFGSVITPSRLGDYYINGENNFIDMGRMIYFLNYHNEKGLFMRKDIVDLIIALLNEWRKEIRNGYFHKDMLSEKEVRHIRMKSFELIYFLLFIQPERKSESNVI